MEDFAHIDAPQSVNALRAASSLRHSIQTARFAQRLSTQSIAV
jgi:hypothetical protein